VAGICFDSRNPRQKIKRIREQFDVIRLDNEERMESKVDKEMRFIFIVIGICILAGILCVVFAVTHNIR